MNKHTQLSAQSQSEHTFSFDPEVSETSVTAHAEIASTGHPLLLALEKVKPDAGSHRLYRDGCSGGLNVYAGDTALRL
ncbi:hypothetical protein [Aliamphritea spongicola]|nr:hypothetical protein [Aliamphritea spongicola]